MASSPDKVMNDNDEGSLSPDSLQDFNEVTVQLEYFDCLAHLDIKLTVAHFIGIGSHFCIKFKYYFSVVTNQNSINAT